jgi:Domain of unknown function (DUF4278)
LQTQNIEETSMKLIYRGATYNYDPAQAQANRATQSTPQAAYDLSYRGARYRVDPSIAKPASEKPQSYELIYRGCTYQVTRNQAGEMIAMGSALKQPQDSKLQAYPAPSVADKQFH